MLTAATASLLSIRSYTRAVLFAVSEHRFGRSERSVEDEGAVTLVRRQICIPAAERQAIQIAHDRHADDFHRNIQVSHHAPNDRQLLSVLLPEVSTIWLDD